MPPPESIKKYLNEFRNFLLLHKNYTTEKTEEIVNSILPDFENVYLLLDLISLGISGPQEAINKILELLSLYGTKINNQDLFYYRFNTIYDLNEDTELDTTNADFLNYIQTAAEQQYQQDAIKIQQFIQKCNFQK